MTTTPGEHRMRRQNVTRDPWSADRNANAHEQDNREQWPPRGAPAPLKGTLAVAVIWALGFSKLRKIDNLDAPH